MQDFRRRPIVSGTGHYTDDARGAACNPGEYSKEKARSSPRVAKLCDFLVKVRLRSDSLVTRKLTSIS